MPNSIVFIDNFELPRRSKVFFDSNIWLYLIEPNHNRNNPIIADKYSRLLYEIDKKDCIIYSNILQISELVNTITKDDYNSNFKNLIDNIEKKFKDFKLTKEGRRAIERAHMLVEQVLKSSSFMSGDFNNDQLKELVRDCSKADFNDCFFNKFCEMHQAILVTHDIDFSSLSSNVRVVTANKNYLPSKSSD